MALTHHLRNKIGSLSEVYSQPRFPKIYYSYTTVLSKNFIFENRLSSLMRGLVSKLTHGNIVFHFD